MAGRRLMCSWRHGATRVSGWSVVDHAEAYRQRQLLLRSLPRTGDAPRQGPPGRTGRRPPHRGRPALEVHRQPPPPDAEAGRDAAQAASLPSARRGPSSSSSFRLQRLRPALPRAKKGRRFIGIERLIVAFTRRLLARLSERGGGRVSGLFSFPGFPLFAVSGRRRKQPPAGCRSVLRFPFRPRN